MPLHKSIQPGDILLKLKIPVADYPLFKIVAHPKELSIDSMMNLVPERHYYFYEHNTHSSVTHFLRKLSAMLNNMERAKTEEDARKSKAKSMEAHIRHNTELYASSLEKYADNLQSLLHDIHPSANTGEYLHFVLIVNSRRARTRGEKFPITFEPFFKKLGVNFLYQHRTFLYHHLHRHSFDIIHQNPELRQTSHNLEDVSNIAPLPAFFTNPLSNFYNSHLHQFMPQQLQRPYYRAETDVLVAPGLSLQAIDQELYEALPVNEYAESILSEMPESFRDMIEYIQRSGHNVQADGNLLTYISKTYIPIKRSTVYYNGTYRSIPENLHQQTEDVRRNALVSISQNHVHAYQHSLLPVHPIFNFKSYPLFMLHLVESIPKNSLPAIELTFQ